MAYSTFTLKGKHAEPGPTGAPHKGRVVVTPNTVIRDAAGGVIMSGPLKPTLDETGAWSLILPCDSTELNPSSGIGYTIVYQFNASSVNPQAFAATADLAGTVLDVSRVLPGATPTAPVTIMPIAFDVDGVPYLTI